VHVKVNHLPDVTLLTRKNKMAIALNSMNRYFPKVILSLHSGLWLLPIDIPTAYGSRPTAKKAAPEIQLLHNKTVERVPRQRNIPNKLTNKDRKNKSNGSATLHNKPLINRWFKIRFKNICADNMCATTTYFHV
jgi:hypothetical protein